MSALKKIFVHLLLLCLVIATINAKSLVKRDEEQITTKPTNYFEYMLNQLKNLANIPIIGTLMRPYIMIIYNTAKRINDWSDGSLSSLVNSLYPCNLYGSVIKCSGSLDRSSLHTLAMKILSLLPFGGSMLPMLELAQGVMV